METFEFMSDLLALSWSLAFSGRIHPGISEPLKREIVSLGRELDQLLGQEATAASEAEETSHLEAATAEQFPGAPRLLVDLPGVMVIFKPENWEVNRGDPNVNRRDVEWKLLSDWLAQTFPRARYPLVHNSDFDFGFIHRLDVPSSGLVMSAKTFTGLALLRFQLDTHELCREYIVVCVNPLDVRETLVSKRLTTDKRSMKTSVSETGSPASTSLKCQAHCWPQQDPDNLDTLLVIKILTGRHHQIRAHLTHLEHPPVGDGKYGQSKVLLKDDHLFGDMTWFEQYFRRPVVPLFLESGPNRTQSDKSNKLLANLSDRARTDSEEVLSR
ncbi:unnamed protein product, partial [Polarella glacialis]